MAFSCFPVPASLASPPCRCDHSLALLSWVSAHPFNKKTLTIGCLPPVTLVCALLAAPCRNEAMHHWEAGRVLPSCALGGCIVTVLGPGSEASFRLRPLASFGLVRPLPNCSVSFCPVLRPAGCTRKMVIDCTTSPWFAFPCWVLTWVPRLFAALVLAKHLEHQPKVCACWLHP